MLYDKRWDKPEVKSDPFSLESLIAWLEKQPEDKTYCYTDTGQCLLSQYFLSNGFENVAVGPYDFDHGSDFQYKEKLPPSFNEIAQGRPRQFGSALDRAREAVPSPQETEA
jgi:hypothetical protein